MSVSSLIQYQSQLISCILSYLSLTSFNANLNSLLLCLRYGPEDTTVLFIDIPVYTTGLCGNMSVNISNTQQAVKGEGCRFSNGDFILKGPSCVSNIKRKKFKLFPPLFEKKHFCLTKFFHTSIRATTKSIQVIKEKAFEKLA